VSLCLREVGDQRGELELQRIDRPGQVADAAQFVACDPYPRGLFGPGQAPRPGAPASPR
jgi:hypothetical protein